MYPVKYVVKTVITEVTFCFIYFLGLIYDLHFWLGSKSTPDEQGSAAALTTQMDDHLKGLPTQYRETEGFESKKFQSYFPSGILIKEGGVASGFAHVETNNYSDIRRLLHVKGQSLLNQLLNSVLYILYNLEILC